MMSLQQAVESAVTRAMQAYDSKMEVTIAKMKEEIIGSMAPKQVKDVNANSSPSELRDYITTNLNSVDQNTLLQIIKLIKKDG